MAPGPSAPSMHDEPSVRIAQTPRHRWRLGDLLGRGRRGSVVWAATAESDRQEAALKQVPLYGLDAKDRELALREPALLAQLQHPALPRYLDHAVTGIGLHETLWIAMERIDGQTLQAEDEAISHTDRQVLDIMAELAEIIAYLHERAPPVIHRDLKPANVIRRSDDRRLVLLDLGSSRGEGPDFGGSTLLSGTEGFLAPEALRGEVGPAIDIYALGMCAIQLLSGRPARQLVDPARWWAPGPWEMHVQVPEAVMCLLESCTDPDPALRPSAREVAAQAKAAREATSPPVSRPAHYRTRDDTPPETRARIEERPSRRAPRLDLALRVGPLAVLGSDPIPLAAAAGGLWATRHGVTYAILLATACCFVFSPWGPLGKYNPLLSPSGGSILSDLWEQAETTLICSDHFRGNLEDGVDCGGPCAPCAGQP